MCVSKCLLCSIDAPTNCYAKLVSAMPAQVLELITGPEKAQLRSQLATLGADEVRQSTRQDTTYIHCSLQASERSFIESALEELEVSMCAHVYMRALVCPSLQTRETNLRQSVLIASEVEAITQGQSCACSVRYDDCHLVPQMCS